MKRYEAKLLREKCNGADADGQKEPGDLSGDSGQISDIAACDSDDPDVVASRLLEADADERNKPLEMIWDPLLIAGCIGVLDGQEQDPD